ncbi:unnamed protein product [Dovyalis caffra]|uniref:Uncharacterized protein n=1 Tax=Dovyalis caffra TaxID=77055 RepID=A0AAV1S3Q2_9ROSI|nr:unnamed protein product [Dovyalis caffra]
MKLNFSKRSLKLLVILVSLRIEFHYQDLDQPLIYDDIDDANLKDTKNKVNDDDFGNVVAINPFNNKANIVTAIEELEEGDDYSSYKTKTQYDNGEKTLKIFARDK